jgi:hypothetical protein
MQPVSLLTTVMVATLCSIVPGGTGWAKTKPPDPLAPTRARLDALQACLGASEALSTLRKGLLWGWNRRGGPPTLRDATPAPPPSPDYLDSLDLDVNACQEASQMGDQDQRAAAMDAIRKDIAIKADDCFKFGMSRKVPVVITTVRGNKVESGWEVFYKWSCACPLQPKEIRAPNLTSPANVELPPGMYSFRAEKKDPDGKVETIAPVEIAVGSAQWVPLELAVP